VFYDEGEELGDAVLNTVKHVAPHEDLTAIEVKFELTPRETQ
jgi:hypothetical protein